MLEHLDAAIEMRRVLGEQYGVNLTSRPDAKLAEIIVKTAYTAAMNQKILATWDGDEEPEPFVLEPPRKTEWVCGGTDILSNRHSFTDPNLMALLNKVKGWTMHWRRWVDANGSVQMDKPSFNAKVKLGDKTYSFGLGGLHSEDDPLVIEADETHAITDIDVSSYYPGLVVEERIAPGHLDADIFCGVFADLMATRLEAKAKKQKEIAQGHEDCHQQRRLWQAVGSLFSVPRSAKGRGNHDQRAAYSAAADRGPAGHRGRADTEREHRRPARPSPARGDGADIRCDAAGARHLPTQQVRRDRGHAALPCQRQ